MKSLSVNLIGTGIGQMASGVFKSVMGIGQIIGGAVQNKKAEKMVPSEVDPTQTAMVDVFRRMRKGYMTGTEAGQYSNILNTGLASNANRIVALSGGNTGSALNALSSAQAGAQEAYGNLAGNLEKNRFTALAMEDQQIDDIAQRRLDVQMMKYLQKKTQAMSNLKAGQSNWIAGVEEFGAGADKFWGGGGAAGMMGGMGGG